MEAIQLIGTIGEGGAEAVPHLIQALRSRDRYHRIFAAQSLERFGVEARVAVPALVGALDDPATHHRAIRALGNIGPEAKEAVPRLEALLTTRDRYVAAAALHRINPEGKNLNLLIEAVGDPQFGMNALSELSELGPKATPAVDAILEAMKANTGRGRAGGLDSVMVADNLRKISPANRAVIPILIDILKDIEGPKSGNISAGTGGMNAYGYSTAADAKSDQLNIATRLVWFDPAEPVGMKVLIDILSSDREPARRNYVAYALRQAGPGARAAIPALKAALQDKDRSVRRAAASALKKIDPPNPM